MYCQIQSHIKGMRMYVAVYCVTSNNMNMIAFVQLRLVVLSVQTSLA